MTQTSPAMLTWILALASVLLSASAQFLMKLGMAGGAERPSFVSIDGLRATLFNPYVLAGLACYGFAAVLWLAVLAKMPLSMAYPLVALAIAIVLVGSALFLGESLPAGRIAGAVLIIAGVIVIGLKG